MTSPTAYTFKQTLTVPPVEALRMFTHATALRDWFTNRAQVEARPGGLLFLDWNSGRYVVATIKKLEPGRKLVLRWDGKDEPEPTTVTVTVKPKGSGSLVTVAHAGLGGGARWAQTRAAVQSGWTEGLENLKSVAETGIDLRQARRLRLGIFYGAYTPEVARKLGAPAARGILIEGTFEGTGARALGLEKGDVLVRLGGKPTVDIRSLRAALEGRHAGEKAAVAWYRGPKKLSGQLELGRFPTVSVPDSPADLAQAMRQHYTGITAALAKLLEGVSEAEASARPGDGWSVKEMLAHLIVCERDYQSWVGDMINDVPVEDYLEFRPNVNQRIAAVVARFPGMAALPAELEQAQRETLALLEALPADLLARKHLYRRAAVWALEVVPIHYRDEHCEQIRAALAAARPAQTGPD